MACPTDAGAVRAGYLRHRATGAPWLPLVLGLEGVSSAPGVSELRLPVALGITDLAVLADFALGAALRTRLAPGTPLPTLSLTLQLDGFDGGEEATVRATADPPRGAVAGSRGEIAVEGRPLGSCVATFPLASEGGERRAPLPWERPSASHPAPGEDLGSDATLEAAAAPALATLAGRPDDRSLADTLVAPRCAEARPGHARGRLEAGAILLNRAGHVQGGALAGLAVATARAAAGAPAAPPLCAHLLFLRPAYPGALDVCGRVLRAGRRATCVRVEVRSGDRTAATADVVLGPAP